MLTHSSSSRARARHIRDNGAMRGAKLPVDSDRLFVEAAARIARLVGNLCVIAMLSDGESR